MKSFGTQYAWIKMTISFTIPELAFCLLGSVLIGSYVTELFRRY